MNKGPSPSLAYVPPDADHDDLVRAAAKCHACHLYKEATQTVFGEGSVHASLVLVGEQPGDQEDKQGHPFVGPAGRVLDEALEAAGIPRDEVYLTNAVKHFKFEPRGKRRLHAKPNAAEIHACHGWLESELDLIRPKLVLCLGATAAQAVIHRTFSITKGRGEIIPGDPPRMATFHPSALLRLRAHDEEAYAAAKAHLEADLAKAAAYVGLTGSRRRRARSKRTAA